MRAGGHSTDAAIAAIDLTIFMIQALESCLVENAIAERDHAGCRPLLPSFAARDTVVAQRVVHHACRYLVKRRDIANRALFVQVQSSQGQLR